MSKESDSSETGVSYIASVSGFAVLKGVLDEGALWSAMIYTLAMGLTSSELYPILNKKKVKEIDMELLQLETEKRFRLMGGESYKSAIENEQPDEYLAGLLRAIDYIKKNLNAILVDCVHAMISEGSLVAEYPMVRENDRDIDNSISHSMKYRGLAMKRRIQLHFTTYSSADGKKANFAFHYPLYLKDWKNAEEIYKNWLKEVKKRKDRVLKDKDLNSEEWKRRILAVYPNMPDDLLNRLVRNPESPFFISSINDYDRTPSRIAALYTARYCGLAENLSYQSYMRICREFADWVSVTEDNQIDDTDLAE